MVLMLRQCCCGCSLKTGTIIIGVLNLIGACFGVVNGILLASVSTKDGYNAEGAKSIGISICVFSAVMVLIASLLIVGATKGKPFLLLPWLICAIILTVIYVILYVVLGVSNFQQHQSQEGAIYIVSAIITALVETYFILVVYSLYREQRGNA
ncbi:hypothetical protein C0J52_17758 [Blattella germanica]|nr:hypothetical protein C0J52_17758 [Blattella germanica]